MTETERKWIDICRDRCGQDGQTFGDGCADCHTCDPSAPTPTSSMQAVSWSVGPAPNRATLKAQSIGWAGSGEPIYRELAVLYPDGSVEIKLDGHIVHRVEPGPEAKRWALWLRAVARCLGG